MAGSSRIHNAFRNITVGVAAHIITAVMSFVCRTVFIKILGVQYLGISGLFSNVLTMLALSDLGVYTVMVYSMYKPLADGDKEKISALVFFFRKLYAAIALVVFALGLLCIPFLPYLINNSTLSQTQTLTYYILLLINSVCTYVGISKSTLLQADQQTHIIHIVSATAKIGLQLLQIIVLVLTGQYAVYLTVQILVTLGSNLTLAHIANKKYPYILTPTGDSSISGIKAEIISNLKTTFLYKLGNAVMNSTDNVLISVLIGTVYVGYYSSYVTVFSLVNSFVMVAIQSILSTVGNYYAAHNDEEKYGLFRFLLLGFYMLAAFCTACYICGMNDFISIWIGEEYLLGNSFVLVLALYRFVFCAVHPIWITRESCGLFLSAKYVMMCAAVVNILLSIVLGKLMGIHGVIAATAISYLCTVFWYEPYVLCTAVFHVSYWNYWKYLLKLIGSTVLPVMCAVVMLFYETDNLMFLFGKFMICGMVTFASFYVTMRNSSEFKRMEKIIRSVLRK